jgi:16S rRNA (cytosine967-C5)-methyltransferase
VSKPLRKKDRDVQLVLLIALYELEELSTPDYAVLNEAVAQTRRIGKKWAAGMVNAVLRRFTRETEALSLAVDENSVARFSHPQWLIDLLKQDWPEQAEQILVANNQRPPMWLRVNMDKISVEDYIKRLETQQIKAVRHPAARAALKLDTPTDVSQLPGFNQGMVSVQDASAQLAAGLLAARENERVLDLCAAPGGKTCHILETADNIDMTAVELDPVRMLKVQQNLDRQALHARLVVGDATSAKSWWDGQLFDRILVDAPCSASGVIRRHPDIKSLRQVDDLTSLTAIQRQILLQAWSMLKPGGTMLYVTCSVLRQENEQQIEHLIATVNGVEVSTISDDWGIACRYGRQLLPGDQDGDGFYFALLKKPEKQHQPAC